MITISNKKIGECIQKVDNLTYDEFETLIKLVKSLKKDFNAFTDKRIPSSDLLKVMLYLSESNKNEQTDIEPQKNITQSDINLFLKRIRLGRKVKKLDFEKKRKPIYLNRKLTSNTSKFLKEYEKEKSKEIEKLRDDFSRLNVIISGIEHEKHIRLHYGKENIKFKKRDLKSKNKVKISKTKYNPKNPFPKDIKIKVPEKPASIDNIDQTLDKLFKKR